MSLFIVYTLTLVASVLAQSSADLFAVNYPIVAYVLSSVSRYLCINEFRLELMCFAISGS